MVQGAHLQPVTGQQGKVAGQAAAGGKLCPQAPIPIALQHLLVHLAAPHLQHAHTLNPSAEERCTENAHGCLSCNGRKAGAAALEGSEVFWCALDDYLGGFQGSRFARTAGPT